MRKKKLLFILASALTMVTQGAWAQSTTTEVLDWDNWCSIRLKLTDSYGDGWQGNAIKIVDVLTNTELGTGTYYNTNENNQSQPGVAQIYQAEVPDDRDIRFEWVSGTAPNECSYEVYDVNGRLIFSGSGALSEPVTYHVECTPSNLQTVDVTATTATLTWDGVQDSYNVRYRTNPSIFEGFEDEDEFANWQAFGVVSKNTASDRFGRLSDAKKTDSFGFSFSSYNTASNYNQYLISPEVSGVLSVDFYYRASSSSGTEKFKVGYSTTGSEVEDFITWRDEISTNSTSWSHFEDNNVPDGVKYVAIHYYADYQYQLFVDDMTINCGSTGEWNETKTNVTSPLAIDGLEPEAKYEWQVQGVSSSKNTDWSRIAKFTTNIVKLDATKTLAENQSAYGTATKFLLDRTLTAGQWNTFASPFAIASGDMEKYFGAGAKVRKLGTTTIAEGNILSLNFVAASSIDAGHPYIVKPAANVDFSADGKEFKGVNLNSATETPTTTTYVDFKPTLGKTTVTGDPENILMLTTSGTLVNPSAVGDIKGFRGYFQLHDPVGGTSRTRAYVIDFGDGETTGIIPIRTEAGAAVSDGATYDLQGRMVAHPTMKGIYIQNGKKLIIK